MKYVVISSVHADKLKGLARPSNISVGAKAKHASALVAERKIDLLAKRLPLGAVVHLDGAEHHVIKGHRLRLAA